MNLSLLAPPRRRYGAILADPPWYAARTRKSATVMKGRDIAGPPMPLAMLKDLRVRELADTDCALFLWCRDHMLDQALDLVKAWGFTYKSVGFHWVRLVQSGWDRLAHFYETGIDKGPFYMGPGHWTRTNVETCMLATRGHPRRLDKGVPKLVAGFKPRFAGHTREVPRRIMRLVDGPYCELFARQTLQGWESWNPHVEDSWLNRGRLRLYDTGTGTGHGPQLGGAEEPG